MSHYTPEEIEKYAELKEADGLVIVADMLRDYAANLRQHGQQEEGAVADVVTHNGLTYGKLRHDLPNGTQLFTRPAARVHTEQVEEGAVAWCEPDVIEQMSPMARWDGVDAIECVLLREQTENHTVPLYTRPAARARVPAYPLWKAIHAASAKAGHPCNVGLAQVSMALEAMEYHGI